MARNTRTRTTVTKFDFAHGFRFRVSEHDLMQRGIESADRFGVLISDAEALSDAGVRCGDPPPVVWQQHGPDLDALRTQAQAWMQAQVVVE